MLHERRCARKAERLRKEIARKKRKALEGAAPELRDVVKDMLCGLSYLRQTNNVPYGFGIDRLETSGKAALAKADG